MTLVDVAGDQFTKGYISQVELGKVDPSFKLLVHIAEKLQVSVEQLLSEENKQTSVLATLENEFLSQRYERVIFLSENINDTKDPVVVKMMLLRSKSLYYMGRYQEAILLMTELLIVDQPWSKGYTLEAYSFMGLSLFAQKLYEQVIELYDEAFKFAEKNGLNTSRLLANMYLNKATAHQNLGAYQEAIITFDETLTFARTNNCMETVLDTFLRKGFCHYKLGELSLAKEHVYNSFRLNKILDIKLLQAESFLVLGYILIEEMNDHAAKLTLSQSFAIYDELDDIKGIVEGALALAKVHKNINEIEEGKKKLLRCFESLEKNDLSLFERALIIDIAKTSMAYGLHEEASNLFSQFMD